MNSVFLVLLLLCLLVAIVFVLVMGRLPEPPNQQLIDLARGRRAAAVPVVPRSVVAEEPPPATAVFVPEPEPVPVAAKPELDVWERQQAAVAATLSHLQLASVRQQRAAPVAQSRARAPGACSLMINYVDQLGVMTTRNVAPYKSGNTNERFHAWCESRQDRRTFFFSSVQSGMDVYSGRPLSRAEVFSYIHPGRKVPADLR